MTHQLNASCTLMKLNSFQWYFERKYLLPALARAKTTKIFVGVRSSQSEKGWSLAMYGITENRYQKAMQASSDDSRLLRTTY